MIALLNWVRRIGLKWRSKLMELFNEYWDYMDDTQPIELNWNITKVITSSLEPLAPEIVVTILRSEPGPEYITMQDVKNYVETMFPKWYFGRSRLDEEKLVNSDGTINQDILYAVFVLLHQGCWKHYNRNCEQAFKHGSLD